MQAQDLIAGMFATNGNRVFKIARIVPLHLTGVVRIDLDGIHIDPTYTHVQIITTRGGVMNAKIDDTFTLINA